MSLSFSTFFSSSGRSSMDNLKSDARFISSVQRNLHKRPPVPLPQQNFHPFSPTCSCFPEQAEIFCSHCYSENPNGTRQLGSDTTIDVQKAPGQRCRNVRHRLQSTTPWNQTRFQFHSGIPVACSFLSTENNHSCIAENIFHVAFATQTSRGKKLH